VPIEKLVERVGKASVDNWIEIPIEVSIVQEGKASVDNWIEVPSK
jgi:cytochrome c551/c552